MPFPPGSHYPRLAIALQKTQPRPGLRVAELRLLGDLERHRAESLGAQSPRSVANGQSSGVPAHGRDGERITLLQRHPNFRFRLIEHDGHNRRIRAEGEQVLRPPCPQLKADRQIRFGLLERQNLPSKRPIVRMSLREQAAAYHRKLDGLPTVARHPRDGDAHGRRIQGCVPVGRALPSPRFTQSSREPGLTVTLRSTARVCGPAPRPGVTGTPGGVFSTIIIRSGVVTSNASTASRILSYSASASSVPLTLKKTRPRRASILIVCLEIILSTSREASAVALRGKSRRDDGRRSEAATSAILISSISSSASWPAGAEIALIRINADVHGAAAHRFLRWGASR